MELVSCHSVGLILGWNGVNNCFRNASTAGGFGGSRDVRCAELGRCFLSSRRPSTALEAGRSKAKKGQSSGGRIERRSVSTGRPKRSNVGESQERTTGGTEGASQAEHQQGRDAADRQTEDRSVDEISDEELNSTWQELGLKDRRAGGKFLPAKGAPLKEATRVGGWGRDKSMQRVITSEEQRASRGAIRERTRSGIKLKAPTSDAPVVKKKKAWNADFDPDPAIRHPPEYYKYGPYGPYAWRGVTVGEIVQGDWFTNQVVYFSHVKDQAEVEDRQIYNVAVDYANQVATFDVNIGVRYFYAFARRKYGPRPDPWEDWTLVAQIAVESGMELMDQGTIFRKIGSKAQDVVSKCVAWARPDLVYVKKPNFQMRLEPQEEFLKELLNLLDPTKDGNRADFFYATLCRLVRVDIEASPSRVRKGFEALDEQGKMECMKHVFTEHPVQLLSSARYERQCREQRGDLPMEDGSADLPFEGEAHASIDPEEVEEEDDQAMQDSDPARNLEGAMDVRGIEETDASSMEQNGEPDRDASKQRVFPQRRPGKPKKRLYYKPELRSAVGPYSYANVIEEIAEIRTLVSRNQSMTVTSVS